MSWFDSVGTAINKVLLVLLTVVTTVFGPLFRMGINRAIKKADDLAERVTTLETERSEVKLLSERIGTLNQNFERYQDTMEANHAENKSMREADRTATNKWRDEVMSQLLPSLATKAALNTQRIEALEKKGEMSDSKGRRR